MLLEVTSDRPALLVLSENWLPGWTARLNGESAQVVRVNHTLRGVPVPAGEYELLMAYEPAPLGRAAWISLIAALAVVGLALGGLRGRHARDDTPTPED
jgi:uncharacterized membrane protein YfhO